jgi:hypothetical protein
MIAGAIPQKDRVGPPVLVFLVQDIGERQFDMKNNYNNFRAPV